MAVTVDDGVTAGAVDGAAAAAAEVDPPQTLRIRIRQHRNNCSSSGSSGCSISHINLAAKLGQKAMRLLMIATRILLTAIIVVLVLITGLLLVLPELGDDSVVTPPHISINSSVLHERQIPTYQQPQKQILAPFVGPFRFVGADGGRDSTVFLPSGGDASASATAAAATAAAAVVERRSFEPVLLEPALPMDRVSYVKLVLGRSKRSVLLGVTAYADADRLSPTNPQDDALTVLLGNFEDTAVAAAADADEECVDGEYCEAEPVVAEDEGVEEDESSRKKSERGRKRRDKSDRGDGKKQQKKHKDKVKGKGKGKGKAEEKDLRRQRKNRSRQDRRHHHQHHEEALGRLRPIYQHGRFDFGSGTYTLRFDPKSATVAVKRQSDGRVFTTQPHHHHFLQQEEQQQQQQQQQSTAWRFVLVARPTKHIHLIEDVEEADKF